MFLCICVAAPLCLSLSVDVQYMAMHLSQTEVDKARQMAEQALKTINVRDQDEKLNVWKALMVCVCVCVSLLVCVYVLCMPMCAGGHGCVCVCVVVVGAALSELEHEYAVCNKTASNNHPLAPKRDPKPWL